MDFLHLALLLFPAGFLLILMAVMNRWPPNSVNRLYGYRTPRSMASQEAWDYAQSRSMQLMNQGASWMVPWTALVSWRFGVEDGILWVSGLMTLVVLLPLSIVERELKQVAPFAPNGSIHAWGWGVTVFLLLSTFVPIEHDGSERERHIRGTVESFGWATRSADAFIRLRGDDTHYYINRALDMGLDTTAWQTHLSSREVLLHVVDRPAGLNWFGSVGPIRGVVLDGDTLYRTGVVKNP